MKVRVRWFLGFIFSALVLMPFVGPVLASGTANESRQAFITALLQSLDIQPVTPSTPDFSDVAPSSPDYGYIEAAFKMGLISGVGGGLFDPTSSMTRAEIAKVEVLALGDGPGALSDMPLKTAFTDDGSIPASLRGYVVEAVALGLLKGLGNGDFGPNDPLTTTQTVFLLNQLAAVQKAGVFTLAANPGSAGVGQPITITETGETGPVSLTVNSAEATITGSTFVATAPGTYFVTGKTGTGAAATLKIPVYGTPIGLKVTAPQTLVANGASQATVTVSAIDANGNTVASDNSGVVELTSSLSAAVKVASPGSEGLVNGVATFTVTAGTVGGSAAVLDATTTGLTPGQTTVSLTPQTPTAVSVTPASAVVENNDGQGMDEISVAVVDQAGEPILLGAYSLSLSLTGPGSIGGKTTATAVYASGHPTTLDVVATQGESGPITITASSQGLTSGSATIQAEPVGQPVALDATLSTPSVTADDLAGSSYAVPASVLTLTAVDQNGNPTPWTGTADITQTSGGTPVSNVSLSSSVPFQNQATSTVPLLGNASKASDKVGSYTLTVSDALQKLTGASATLQVTPGTPASVSFTDPASGASIFVAAAHPTFTATAQVSDAEGNLVPDGGLPVTFAVSPAGSASPTTASTGATGIAQSTITVPPTLGATESVSLSVPSGALPTVPTGKLSITVEATVTTSLTARLSYGGGTQAQAGSLADLAITTKDAYGNPTSGDEVTLVLGAGVTYVGGMVTCTTGTPVTCTGPTTDFGGGSFQVTRAGQDQVQVTDISVQPELQATTFIQVLAGSQQNFVFVDANGDPLWNNAVTHTLAFSPGVPVEVWLERTDDWGNQAPFLTSFSLSSSSVSTSGVGEFRLSESGTDLTSTTVPAGTETLPVYYINTGTSQNADLYPNLSPGP